MKAHDTSIELLGTVTSMGVAFPGVRARIVLPASPFERPQMKLYPTSANQLKLLMASFKASFEASRPASVGGSGEERIQCKELNMLSGSNKLVSNDIQRHIITCEPVGIWHSTHRETGPPTPAGESRVVLRLTPTQHIGTSALQETHVDGSCSLETVRRTALALLPDVRLTFDRHYVWAQPKRNLLSRFGFPVGLLTLKGDYHAPEALQQDLLPAIDDVLALVSLAGSHRTVCVGWRVADKFGRRSRYDRGGIGNPPRESSIALDNGLVPIGDLEAFLATAWPAFQTSAYQSAIRSAIFSVVPMFRVDVESRFLSLFASLEELVLVHRRRENAEYVIPPSEWHSLAGSLKRTIRDELAAGPKQRRKALYENLPALNRVALRTAFEQFVTALGVSLSDLWPVYSDSGDGLAALRNRIVHGDLQGRLSIGSLGVAARHLQWILERVVLTLLGWPIERSEVRPAFLKAIAADMDRLVAAREEFVTRVTNAGP